MYIKILVISLHFVQRKVTSISYSPMVVSTSSILTTRYLYLSTSHLPVYKDGLLVLWLIRGNTTGEPGFSRIKSASALCQVDIPLKLIGGL